MTEEDLIQAIMIEARSYGQCLVHVTHNADAGVFEANIIPAGSFYLQEQTVQ
jgi:hypothetical protein